MKHISTELNQSFVQIALKSERPLWYLQNLLKNGLISSKQYEVALEELNNGK